MTHTPQRKVSEREWSSSDLCLPIYLDQQTVFDMLAVLEDGLANVTLVKSSVGRSGTEATAVKASFGVKLLELVNIGADASKQVQENDSQQSEISETRTHTPVSLFCNLRSRLIELGLVEEISEADQLRDLSTGSLVEIKVRLQMSPVVDILNRTVKIIDLAKTFEEPSTPPSSRNIPKKGQNRQETLPNPNENLFTQLKIFHEQITNSGSVEYIGKCDNSADITSVISLNKDSLIKDDSEFIGNVFSIFGKVANVIPTEGSDRINLLSRTPLVGINVQLIDSLFRPFSELAGVGFELPDIITEVEGPALQILPIAVFL